MAKFPPCILDICVSRSVVSLTFRPFRFWRNCYCHNSVSPSISLDVVVKRKILAHAWHWTLVTPFVNNHVIVVGFLLGNSPASEVYMPTFRNTVPYSQVVWAHTTCEDGTDSVPKRRYIRCRRRGITKKKGYINQNTAKVWNQEPYCLLKEKLMFAQDEIQSFSRLKQKIKVWSFLILYNIRFKT
jgi:uncharacterized membrane protein